MSLELLYRSGKRRPARSRRWEKLRGWLLGGLLLAASGTRAVADSQVNAKLAAQEPFPALVAAAQAWQIPLNRFDSAPASGKLTPGDSATLLVTFCEKGGRRRQWLLHLQVVAPVAAELATPPPPAMVLYASDGTKLEYPAARAFVTLRLLGPYVAAAQRRSPEPKDTTTRFELNEGFLGIGLDQAAAAMMRLQQTGVHGSLNFSSQPPNAAGIAKGRKLATAVQLTPEEAHALGGAVPALLSYITIIQQTRGLNDILFQLVDLPSWWSIARHGGVTADLSFQPKGVAPAGLTGWHLPVSSAVYDLPLRLQLNQQDALHVTLVVTRPHPPVLLCGGVVGLLAERPGDAETYLKLRVLGARISRPQP